MTSQRIDKGETENLLYLMACAVNDASPDPTLVPNIDMPVLLKLAKFHSVAAMVGLALKKALPLSPEWDKEIASSEYRYVLMKVERSRIFASLAQKGIHCACLKGIILAEHYPSPAMREMCDNDILYEYTPENARIIRKTMEGMGYNTKAFDEANTDEYVKSPIYNFEMHAALESAETANLRNGDHVFDAVWKHTVPLSSEPGVYALDPSDFYLYFIAHAYKHYRTGTIGVRVLGDAYIVRRTFADKLDENRVKNGLRALGATEFDTQLNGLAMDLMSDPSKTIERFRSIDSSHDAMIAMMLDSGTYGTSSTVIQRRLGEMAKTGEPSKNLRRHYLAGRLFPSVEIMGMCYPVCRKHPMLLPFFYVYRILHGAVTKQGAIRSELSVLDSELTSTEEHSNMGQNHNK